MIERLCCLGLVKNVEGRVVPLRQRKETAEREEEGGGRVRKSEEEGRKSRRRRRVSDAVQNVAVARVEARRQRVELECRGEGEDW